MRADALTRAFVCLVINLTVLCGCQGPNEKLGLVPHMALSGDDAPSGDGGATDDSGNGVNLTRSFELKYAIAAYDQQLIDTGATAPPSADNGQPTYTPTWPVAGSQQTYPSVRPTPSSYKPTDFVKSDPCQTFLKTAADSAQKIQVQATSSTKKKSTSNSSEPQAATAPPSTKTTQPATATIDQAESGSGCSYGSVHSRQLAVAGFALADSNCRDFFDKKGNVQTGSTFLTDIVSGGASIGGAVIGLVTGAAAVPAAVGSVVGISGQAQSITNKDFLFGQDNIDDVRGFVFTALNQHTAAVLPDPDISEWTFAQAVAAIREHEAICFPPKILTLIKQAVSKATIQATTSDGTVTAGCTSSGAATPPKITTMKTQRPTTHSATVSVAANDQCTASNTTAAKDAAGAAKTTVKPTAAP